MKSPAKRRGLTLAELLVTAALILVLLGVLSALLISVSRVGHESLVRASAQQNLAVAGRTIERDLDEAHGSGITLDGSGHWLVVHPLKGVSPDGALTWQDRIFLYQYDSSTRILYRKDSTSPATDFPTTPFDGRAVRLTPQALAAIPPELVRSGRPLLRDASEVVFGNPPGVQAPLVGDPLTVVLEVAQVIRPERPPITVRLEIVRALRNRGN